MPTVSASSDRIEHVYHAWDDGLGTDFVEVMDVNDRGLIEHHCLYWGWRDVGILQRGEYHR